MEISILHIIVALIVLLFITRIEFESFCNVANDDTDYTSMSPLPYPYGFPQEDLTEIGSYDPHVRWNKCGGCSQRRFKHF